MNSIPIRVVRCLVACRRLALICSISLAGVASLSPAAPPAEPVNGTTGTPLGGFGAGGVKFNANDGTFAACTRPPVDAYDFQKVDGARFHLFVQRGDKAETAAPLKAVTVDGRPDDDAAWPTHRVNFGMTSDVRTALLAFSPLDRVDPNRMSLPLAFYELTVTNVGSSSATVTGALQWATEGQAALTPGRGFASDTWAVYADSSDAKAIITAGDGAAGLRNGGFAGFDASAINCTAVQVTLAPQESKTLRFVLAWYNRVDPELAYYQSVYADPAAIADAGLAAFDTFRQNAVNVVTKVRGSNLPAWLTNQTLNTLANLTTNSIYKKDGRVAFAEGQWTCFGTMDQVWHARQIVSQIAPFFAWQELRYWARTQRKDGQIHHDFNQMDAGKNKAGRSVLAGWDDTEHKDYRNIDKWVDLNCAYIISVFETHRLTGDTEELDFHWPHMKRATQRMFDQVKNYGSKTYPFTFDKSENSYDAGGDPNPYNASLSAVAYRVMSDLARSRNEPALADACQNAYETVVESFRQRYLKSGFPLGKHGEGKFAGQWLALHLKLGEIWTAAETDAVLRQLDSYYHPFYSGIGVTKGTYDEWTPYLLTHYAGLLLNTRREPQWRAMQHDAYTRQYFDRNKVFNHPLDVLPAVTTPKWIATEIKSKKQYISLPGVWRNYYDIVGFHRDRSTQTLWLTPIVPAELNHRMTGAFYFSPEGDGTIDCVETGELFQNREIHFRPERPMDVRTLRLTDSFGGNVSVTVNGQPVAIKRIGTGYAKELAVAWAGTVGQEGLRIVVTGDPGTAAPPLPPPPSDQPVVTTEPAKTINAFAFIPAASATQSAGVVMADGKVTSCNNFDYVQFERVDFGTGANRFLATVKALAKDCTIEIVLGTVSGETIGTCPVPNPNAKPAWADVSAAIKPVTGVHDVFLKFYGSSPDDLMHLDQFKFAAEKR